MSIRVATRVATQVKRHGGILCAEMTATEQSSTCPICGKGARVRVSPTEKHDVTCRTCGVFSMSIELIDDLPSEQGFEQLRPFLSAATRQASESGQPLTLLSTNWREHAEAHATTSISGKAQKLLKFLRERSTALGDTVRFRSSTDFPLMDAASSSECDAILTSLENRGLVEYPGMGIVALTVDGWEALGRTPSGRPTERSGDRIPSQMEPKDRSQVEDPQGELRRLESLRLQLDNQDAILREAPAKYVVPVAGAKPLIHIFKQIAADYPGMVPGFQYNARPSALRSQIQLARTRIQGKIDEIERAFESATQVGPTRAAAGGKVCLAHGQSAIWRELKDFLEELELEWDEFNRVPTAGTATVERLKKMLDDASIAFIVMTPEDEQPDGTMRPRQNVVHEAGLFQGRLGFERALVLREDGCVEFSNIAGLTVIPFQKGRIRGAFEEVRRVLKGHGLL
jgi:predicted nucleotide-binding protein with TIR-like domain